MYLRGSRPVLSCEKWKSQLLTVSSQKFVTDRPVLESESDFVRPKFWERSVGHKIFTLTPTRPFSHERTGGEPRRHSDEVLFSDQVANFVSGDLEAR